MAQEFIVASIEILTRSTGLTTKDELIKLIILLFFQLLNIDSGSIELLSAWGSLPLIINSFVLNYCQVCHKQGYVWQCETM